LRVRSHKWLLLLHRQSSFQKEHEMHEHQVTALVEEYKWISSNMVEQAKLSYQLVGISYVIAGAALAFMKQPSTTTLFFPPIFCAIVAVQAYLHSYIQSLLRYVNFRLRPAIEEIIATETSAHVTVWAWGDYWVESHLIPTILIKAVGTLVVYINLLPAIGALLFYGLNPPVPVPSNDELFFRLDIVLILLTFIFAYLVFYLNAYWWELEKRQSQRLPPPVSE
jgi:hypothetical protein